MDEDPQNIIIYNTKDALYAKDSMVWMNQNQLAQLFDTSKQNIGQHISNILTEVDLEEIPVVKNLFTIAADGKEYNALMHDLEELTQLEQKIEKNK